jgi:phosphatidylserine decarboxylase
LDLEDGRVKITYFDRLSGGIQEEEVFESGAMRFLYRNPLGRLVSEIVVKRAFFSRLYAKGKNSPRSRAAIGPFIERYGIDSRRSRSRSPHSMISS